jgi:hypothetical protein
MWRNFALVLVLLNLAAFAFAWLKPMPEPAKPRAVDPDIAPLVLLEERSEAELRAAGRAVRAEQGAPPRPDALLPNEIARVEPQLAAPRKQCVRVGPFEKQSDANAWLSGLTVALENSSVRAEEEMIASGFWVYLPQVDSREAALALSRRLSSAGVRDFYVVTTGESANSISLGVFRDAINADKRVAQVQALGFTPRRVERGEPKIKHFAFAEFAATQRDAVQRTVSPAQRMEVSACRSG